MSTTTFYLSPSGGRTDTLWRKSTRPYSPAPSLVVRPASLLERIARRYRDYRTLRAFEAMPMDLRKDIGWPAPDEA